MSALPTAYKINWRNIEDYWKNNMKWDESIQTNINTHKDLITVSRPRFQNNSSIYLIAIAEG